MQHATPTTRPLDTSTTTRLVLWGVTVWAAVTYPVYRYLDIPHATRPAAAAAMSIPGMFLDVLILWDPTTFFPELTSTMATTYAAVLFFGHAIVLLTGFIPIGPATGV